MAARFLQSKQPKTGGERASKTEASLYNQTLEVTSHDFVVLLFFKSRLMSPANTEERDILQKHEYKDVEITGAMLVCQPHGLNSLAKPAWGLW